MLNLLVPNLNQPSSACSTKTLFLYCPRHANTPLTCSQVMLALPICELPSHLETGINYLPTWPPFEPHTSFLAWAMSVISKVVSKKSGTRTWANTPLSKNDLVESHHWTQQKWLDAWIRRTWWPFGAPHQGYLLPGFGSPPKDLIDTMVLESNPNLTCSRMIMATS